MHNKSRIIEHLQLIQKNIHTYLYSSLICKGISVLLLISVIFIDRLFQIHTLLLYLVIFIPFFVIDSYYNRHYYLFKRLYNNISLKDDTDYSMSLDNINTNTSLYEAIRNIYLFYIPQIIIGSYMLL